MKEAFWGVLIIVLGLFGVVVVNLFQNVTVDNDRVYYLIKESTEASAYDAIDLTYYRLSGDVRMVEDKFIENLTRRFAENVTIGNYQIVVFDVNEIPPKVSLGITSGITSLRGEKFNIQNRVDGVIETKYTLDEILDFLGITEEEWNNYRNKANPSSSDGSGKCNLGIGSDDNATCISGDIVFTGFGGTSGLKRSYCQTDTLPSNVARTANYKECNCGKWEDKSDIVYSNPTKTGRVGTYTWNFNKTSDVRTVHESITEKVNIDICTTSIAIQTPKDKDQIKPSNNPNEPSTDNSAYVDCPAGGIRIPIETQVTLHPRYIPPEATNRRLTWTSSNTSIGTLVVSQPPLLCTLNSAKTNCMSKAVLTARGIGDTTVTIKTTNDKTATCKVTVWDGTPDSMKCEDTTLTIGQDSIIKSSYTPKNSSKTNFTFTSSDPSIVSITGNNISALKTGTITVTMKETNSGKTTTCKITSNKPKVVVNTGGSGGSGGDWGGWWTKNPVTGKIDWYSSEKAMHEGAQKISKDNGNKKVEGGSANSNGLVKTGNGVYNKTSTTVTNTWTDNNGNSKVTITSPNGQVVEREVDKNGKITSNKVVKQGNSGGGGYSGGGGGGGYSSGGGYSGGSGSRNSPGAVMCFIAGMKVETINGPKNIEDIKVGDKVLSYNEVTKETEYKEVTRTFVHDDNTELIYKIVIGGEVIKATGNHPFYVDGVYKEAKELKVGDKLLNKNGIYVEIEEITTYESDALVYNIEVADNHNYYVENYLVHNKGGGGGGGHSAQYGSRNSPGAVCFIAGMKVETINGPKNIEDIKVGDKVLSYNEVTKETEYKEVTRTFVHDDNTELIYKIVIGGEVIKATGNHPFYVDGVYKEAKELKVGDKLLNKNGIYVEIEEITTYESDALVYNIEVADNHNYYVENYLVHNKKCFIAGTKVMTENGLKSIEEIKAGDKVLSYNVKTGIKEYNKVINKYVYDDETEDLYEIMINGEVLTSTGNHPFYININYNKDFKLYDSSKLETKNKYYTPKYYDKYTRCETSTDCWTQLKYLKVGNYLLGADGKYYRIESIEHYSINQSVYNLEVENNRNYYVGNSGYLVQD